MGNAIKAPRHERLDVLEGGVQVRGWVKLCVLHLACNTFLRLPQAR